MQPRQNHSEMIITTIILITEIILKMFMKKLLIVILLFCIIPIPGVCAADAVSFSVDSIECKNNRLIEVNVNAQCGTKLSAALFEFSYDKSILEFRGVNTPDGSITEYNENASGVKLSYLCTDGAEISASSPIFKLKFKSIGEGRTDIAYNVSDCVDSDVRQMTIGSCTAGSVTVTSKAKETGSTSAKTRSQTGKTTSESKSGKKSASLAAAKKTTNGATGDSSSYKDLGNVNDVIQKDFDKATPIIILCASIVICAAFIGFLTYKIVSSRKDKAKQDKDNKIE